MSIQTTQSPIASSDSLTWLTVDQWQKYVEWHPDSSVFHHRNWIELLNAQYGMEISIPAITRNEKIVAAIPLLQTRNLRGKKKLISLPFTDYLPILADDAPSAEALCQLLRSEYRDSYEAVVLRASTPVNGLKNESFNVRHILKTDLPLDEIKSGFASAIKRNLNKGRRKGLEFHKRQDDDAMDTFYRLQVLTRRKLGVPVQPKSYFRRLSDQLIKTKLGFVAVVTKENQPIAAGVLLGFNGRLTYKYAASDPTALEHRPNDWLVYNSIRIAAEEGFQLFDFGISDKSQEGLRRFKSKWGAEESDIFYSYIVGEPDPDSGPSRAVLLAGEIIKRSPTLVCRLLGKAFYKYSQ